MGLRLSEQKTKITHIDDGLDLLGWRIRRHPKRGTNRQYVYTYPARRAVHAVTGKPTRDGPGSGRGRALHLGCGLLDAQRDEPYHDLGADRHSRRNDQAHTRRLSAQLEHLGHTVIINPAA
jgi:hypothetical protein